MGEHMSIWSARDDDEDEDDEENERPEDEEDEEDEEDDEDGYLVTTDNCLG